MRRTRNTMTAKTPKIPAAALPLYIVSEEPGGFIQSKELDRANAFASKRLALEAAIALPRDQVADALRQTSSDWVGEFQGHAFDLAQAATRADSLGHIRELEALVLQKVSLFTWGESCAVTLAKKEPDRFQIQAAALAVANAAETDRYRVRSSNY